MTYGYKIWFEYNSDNVDIKIIRDIWDFFFINGEDNQQKHSVFQSS